MKTGIREVKSLQFVEGSNLLTIHFANRGEPYRQGVELNFDSGLNKFTSWVMLDRREVLQLRDKLNEFLGEAE